MIPTINSSEREHLLFLGTSDDVDYIPRLKGLVGSASVTVITSPVSTLTQLEMYCKPKGITGIICTSVPILRKLLEEKGKDFKSNSNPSLDAYSGSYFSRNGIEYVFINPLSQLVSVNYGKFLAQRYISKLSAPKSWNATTAFHWELLTPSNIERIYYDYQNAFAIACDIETLQDPLSIRCIGFTAIYLDAAGIITTHSSVLPLDSMWSVVWMRKFCLLEPAKIFQNGKYDISYLALYRSPVHNYLWDTKNLFHCWYSELPKDLAFLNSFFVREAMYWKDLADTNDLMEYYRYNALDTWATANVWIQQMLQLPEWARKNYVMEFPLVFPWHLCEMTGIKRDEERREKAFSVGEKEIEALNKSIEIMTATPNLNSNSHLQVKSLLKILGCGDLIKSSDEKTLKKAAYRHPLNARIFNAILSVRKKRKLNSTYLGSGKEYNGRILYSGNPDGTDSGRAASREHHFWCGLQIQNITRGPSVKQTLVADDEFYFAEVDLEQAEARDVGYLSGDENLIAAVSGTRDFHSVNASAFFGLPYASIYSDELGKTLNKDLRDTSKRVNHGANYNIAEKVLADTMGEEAVWKAKSLLKAPICKYLQSISPSKSLGQIELTYKLMGVFDVTKYMLIVYDKTYPGVKGAWYDQIIHEVITTNKLVGATGWTRYCFGKPSKTPQGKSDLNAVVAHEPQSLNAMVLNKAFMRVFYEIAVDKKHRGNFKLIAQIHDSILFQYRIGHEYLCEMVKEMMEIPVTVKGADGKIRTFTVPAAIKNGSASTPAKYWSEVE